MTTLQFTELLTTLRHYEHKEYLAGNYKPNRYLYEILNDTGVCISVTLLEKAIDEMIKLKLDNEVVKAYVNYKLINDADNLLNSNND